MIYDLLIQTKKGKKQMYLSANSKTALYKRCWDMYLVPKTDIIIQNEIDETELDISMKADTKVSSTIKRRENNYSEKALELFNSTPRGLTEEEIAARLLKGFEVKDIKFNITDIDELCNQYDKVKVYYRRTGAKKNKEYIALVK